MKKIIVTIGLILTVLVGYTQNCDQATFTTEPASFTVEDEVKLSVDLTGCSVLAGLDEVYIWIFVEGRFGPNGVGGNGDFCDGSNTELLMTNEGGNVWSFTFTPVDLFDATAAEIGAEIGFIPKAFAACKTAGDQTNNLALTVDPLEFVPSEERIFPAKFEQDDFITFYFDQSLASNSAMSDLEEIFVHTWVNRTDVDGNDLDDVTKAEWADVATTKELKLTNEGNGVFSLTVKPDEFYAIEDSDIITRINYIFRNAAGDTQTATFESSPIILE